MMGIPPIERMRLDDVAVQENEALPVHAPNLAKAALTLEQKLHQDLLEELSAKAINQATENATIFSSIWNTICFWKQPEKERSQVSAADLRAIQEGNVPEKISHVPEIEAPDIIPADLQAAKFPLNPKKANGKNQLTPTELCETLGLMSERSIEAIMFIIFKNQLELEKETAHVIEGTFSKYMEFQKLQQKMLQEMKDVLVKDENLAGTVQTVQKFILAASFIAGLLAVATTFGVFTSVAGLIHGSTIILGGLTGLSTATKAYFKSKFNEHQANHQEIEHFEIYYENHTNYSQDRLMSTAEADMAFKDKWIQLLKRNDKMRKIVFKK